MKPVLAYIVAFIILILVALLGKRATIGEQWYNCIKPAITPPSFVFPIVWTALYFFIALVLAQVLMLKVPAYGLLVVIGINLVLNVAWSYLYFGLKQVRAAFVVTILLILTSLVVIRMLWSSCQRWVALLFVPYTAWLIFACVLNGLSVLKEPSCRHFKDIIKK